MCDGSRSEAKKEKEICRYFVHGRCKKGKWCEFSHHRPLCRYGSHCWFGPWCWNSHGITPRVNSIRTARKPGKQSARNKRRREKRKVLMAEAKASLVKIKELETQLGLKEKKTDELQESERQLAGLQAQLEEETRIAKAHQERAITTDLELTQVTEMMVTAKEKCAEEVSSMKSESEKREKMLHEMKEHYVNLEQYTEKLADALKLEQEKNVILGMDLKLEQEKNREQVLKQYRIAAKRSGSWPNRLNCSTPRAGCQVARRRERRQWSWEGRSGPSWARAGAPDRRRVGPPSSALPSGAAADTLAQPRPAAVTLLTRSRASSAPVLHSRSSPCLPCRVDVGWHVGGREIGAFGRCIGAFGRRIGAFGRRFANP
ncbi:unnamed protein product [Heterosigma akashiwo]